MPRLWRTVISLMIALTIGAGITPFVPTLLPAVPAAQATSVPIVLIGSVYGWNASTTPNPTITVTQGDTVSITLSSTDTIHQFALDVDRDGPMFFGTCPSGDTCSKTFNPTGGTTVTFTASFPAGTYTYFCTFHPTMVGSFIVTPPPPAPAPATLVHGKLSWTHHLSLAKNTAGQSWTAVVENPSAHPVYYLIHITASSVAGTTNSFNVMCGSNGCFGAGSSTGTPTPILVSTGPIVKKGPDFTQMIPFTPPDKFCFTATLMWGNSPTTVTTASNSKSGCFAVVP